MRIPSVAAAATAFTLICVAIPTTASAQKIGALIGANISTISEADQGVGDVLDGAFDKKKRVGLKAGFYLTIPLAGAISLQPEVLYAQNGVTYQFNDGSNESVTVKLGYVEVPVLLRADIARNAPIHPLLMFGGSGAYRVQCEFGAPSGTGTVSQKCDAGNTEDPVKKTDYSVIGGAGLAAKLGGLAATLQVRYTHGISNIASEDTDQSKPKNRAFSVLLGFSF